MVLVVFVMALLTLLSVLLIDTVQSEGDRSAQAVRSDAAFQAAEAGVDDYIAKLIDDRLYYAHQVHAGEATRLDSGGTQVAAGNAWAYSLDWTYPNGSDTWRQLTNGYEYSLQITPPEAGSLSIRILSTGRKAGSDTDQRTIEVLVRPSSIADFQRVVNGNVGWGSTATTNGKLYANGTINHDGTARADVYAEVDVTGSTTFENGAQAYDSTNIRTVIKNPVNFNALLASLVDIQRASQVAGVYLDDPSKSAWRLTFQSDGTFLVESCTPGGNPDPAVAVPVCGSATTYSVPSNGAVYTAQTAIVSGSVNGRVTVGSNDDIVIANNIDYVTTGDDVLGLVAKNDVLGAAYVPATLTWRAGVIAQSGTWKGAGPTGSKTLMVWQGSSTTQNGGNWVMFNARDYSYDESLLYLPPPWFPTIDDAYTVVLFRELPAP
jgi:Tfp pilus assembly protein PilX